MSQFQNHPDFFDQPIRLTDAQKERPLEVVRIFFQNCHLHEVRRTLWKMIEAALTIHHSVYDEAVERSHLLWFYKELETMIEAALVLCEKGKYEEAETKLASDSGKGPHPLWRNKTMLEDEIRSLRIKNAEQETELMELRYFKKHGKPFKP